MTRTMYDSTNVNDLPANGDLYAGYVAGSYTNYAQVKARFPTKPVVSITPRRFAADGSYVVADVLDVETGNTQPTNMPSWVSAMRAQNRIPTVYCPASMWQACKNACAQQHIEEPLWWIAKYDNIAKMLPGAVAKQYGGNVQGHYDVSIVADHWPGVDPAQPPLPPLDPPTHFGDSMTRLPVRIKTDDHGRGYADINIPIDHVISIVLNGGDPSDGWDAFIPAPVYAIKVNTAVSRIVLPESPFVSGNVDVVVWCAD